MEGARARSAVALGTLCCDRKGCPPVNAFLVVKGQKQGDIRGSVTQRPRENSILVQSISHEIVSPRDVASGQATGKRQHKPLSIRKTVDKSSPQLWRALASNELFVA